MIDINDVRCWYAESMEHIGDVSGLSITETEREIDDSIKSAALRHEDMVRIIGFYEDEAAYFAKKYESFGFTVKKCSSSVIISWEGK